MKKKWHDFAKGLLIIFCFFLIVELVGCKKKKLNVDVNRVYQITYHLNGAVDLDLPTTFTKKNQIILKTPFRAEYRFDGWYFSSDFGGEKVTEINGTIQKNIELYAKWNKIYYLSLVTNGGEVTENFVEFTSNDEIMLEIPTKDNANFQGWYLSSDFEGNAITQIDKGTSEDITLFAKWQNIYKVNMILNDGTLDKDLNIYFSEDEEVILPIPYKENYIFSGWYLDDNFKGEPVTKIDQGTTRNVIVFAKWERQYQISYDVQGGTMPDIYDTTYVAGEEKMLPVPTKNGYTFKGWSESPDNTLRVHFMIPISYEEDLNLIAIWEKRTYQVNYILGEERYADKHQLFLAFFSDFYNYIVNYRGDEEYLLERGITSLNEFLITCSNYTGGAAGMSQVGNLLGPYYITINVGGDINNQTADQGYIGYCLENNKYVEFIYFIEDFFYWWRLDEGYTNGPDDPNGTGSDFLASSWASIVDTAKFFYYDKDTLPSYFISKGHVPAFYDRIPYVVNVGENHFVYTYDWEEELILPTELTLEGYEFVGWYDNPQFTGEVIEVLMPNIYHDITLYAKFIKK